METVPCLAPWMCLILADTAYGPCCHHEYPTKRVDIERAYADPQALVRMFNSEDVVALRRQMLENKLPYSCRACIKAGYNIRLQDVTKGRELTPWLQQHVEKVLALVARGEEAENLHPIAIHLSQNAPCNLRCVFCEGAPPRLQDVDKAHGLFRRFFQTLEEIGWERIGDVYLSGGEPFFNPGLLRFMYEYDWSKAKGVRLATVSNATMLHKHFDLLQRVDHLYIRLSIDAMGETYNALRRGASWEKTLGNLHEMSRIKKNKDGWTVEIHSILMRSSLPYMTRLMDLAHDLGFDFSVNSIRGNYLNENIFFFADLLEGLDWEEEMDSALATAARHGFVKAEKTLRHLRGVLSVGAAGGKADVQSLACPDGRLRMYRSFFASLAGRRFAIWGTDHSLLDYLQQEDHLPGLGFVLDVYDRLRTYCGHAYRSITSLEADRALLAETRAAVEVVVVACSTFKARHTMERAQALFPDCEVLIRPFWEEKAQRNMEALVASGRPYVAFGAGGTAWVLMTGTILRTSGLVAFSDNNPALWGTELLGKRVIAPQDIPDHADRVVIFSEAYYDEIRDSLRELHNDRISIVPLF